ncbi:MAG: hypothetical protein KC591_15355, partial [Gemmatimonadetes bacterium]|nr:hypothetical protein [Gemmatimonadota bacterium]
VKAYLSTIGGLALALLLTTAPPAIAACPEGEVPFPIGTADDFELPSEAPQPSRDFEDYMDDVWPEPSTRQFDEVDGFDTLIHSFTGWSGPVCAARLELRLQGSNLGQASDDTIRLHLVGGFVPDALFGYVTPIANVVGAWDAGSVATVELDLADLPPSGSFPTNILDVLSDGELEIAVENDTGVDYAILHVCTCATPVEGDSWGRIKAGYLR